MSATPVSLLLPNRNNARSLELVAVDDGSRDRSVKILRRWRDSGRFTEMRLIEREQGGAPAALNAGLEAARGELVVQLDGDASVETAGWLERMVAFVESDARVGAACAKVVFDWGELHACGISVVGPEGLHDRGTRIDEPAGRRTYHGRVRRPREHEAGDCRRAAEVDGAIGCCMIYRREAALAAGGYDVGFSPVWFDDLDLTLSLRRQGMKVFALPEVRVVHHIGLRFRDRQPTWLRVARGLRWRLGIKTPSKMPPEHRERLLHHYDYWRRKWGFDILNPDMDAVHERWGGTEVCWRYDEEMRRQGERIVAAHEAAC